MGQNADMARSVVDLAARGAVLRRSLPQIARIVIVAAVSWQLCLWLGAVQAPIYAALVPLLSLRSEPFSSFSLALDRFVGVVLGLAIGTGVLAVLDPGAIAAFAVLGLALLVGAAIGKDAMNIQVAVSALLVFTALDARDYGLTRLWETAVGAGVTLLLTPFLFPADPWKAAQAELRGLAAVLGEALRDIGRITADRGVDNARRTSALVEVTDRLEAATNRCHRLATQITSATKSARWSVLRRSQMRAVADLQPVGQLADRLTEHLRTFAEESLTLAGRPTFADDPHLLADSLREATEPAAEAMQHALVGEPFATDLASAIAVMDSFRAGPHSHLASVLRRPLHRLIEDLQQFAGAGRQSAAGLR